MAWAKAALGEKVPAKPPDSVPRQQHVSTAVHADEDADVLVVARVGGEEVGVGAEDRVGVGPGGDGDVEALSINCQCVPSELGSVYWLVEEAIPVIGIREAIGYAAFTCWVSDPLEAA